MIQRLSQAGWEVYIVGGAVRDFLCGLKSPDYDLVTNAPLNAIKKLFQDRKVVVVGVNFSVCLVDQIEIASFRRADTLAGDLGARDLTINTLAFSPLNGQIVDLYGGVQDLKNKLIRLTGNPQDRIREDACRIVRAARFLAKLEGTFEPQTLKAMQDHAYLVKTLIAPERLRLEILKVMSYRRPSLFFDALHRIGILKDIFPGLTATYGHDGGPHHGEKIDMHLKLTGDFLPARKPLLRLAGYLHDIGKPVVAQKKDNRLVFYDHARQGAEMAEAELRTLKFSLQEIFYLKALIQHHMRSSEETKKPATLRRMLRIFQKDGITWKDWLQLKIADHKANLKKKKMDPNLIKIISLRFYRQLRPKTEIVLRIKELAVNGRDIMQTLKTGPGPGIGQILQSLLEDVIDDPDLNTREVLLKRIKLF